MNVRSHPCAASASGILALAFVSLAAAQEPVSQPHVQPAAQYPIDLPTALRLAGAQNLDVQLARNAVAEAHANSVSAFERFVPAIIPSAAYLHHSGWDQAVTGQPLDVIKRSEAKGIYATAQVPLGEAVFESLQARQVERASEAGAAAQQQDSTLAAAQQYFELVRSGAVVGIVRQALEVSQSYERQLKESVTIGLAFKGDALRVETQSQRLLVDLSRAQQQQRLAATRLAQILRLDPMTELVPAEHEPEPLALGELTLPTKELVDAALHNRPELARAAALTAAAERSRQAAIYGPLIPEIGAQDFSGTYRAAADDAALGGGSRHDYGVGLSWRIGPGGLLDWGRIEAGRAHVTSAQLTEEKLRDEIEREVVDAHTRVESLFQELRAARQNVASAEETLRLTRGRKELGVGIVLEDLQAQQELLRSRSDLVSIITELNQQQFGLLRSVGHPLSAL